MRATVAGARECFCCYGCVLAAQVTRERGESGVASAVMVRLGLAVFFAMNAMMLSLPTYAPHVYGDEALPADGALFQVLRILAMVFAAPVLALLGWPILAGAVRGMRGGLPNTDALIILGVIAAYALSVANTVSGRGDVYFDTAAMLLVLVTVGRYLEARVKADASAVIRARLSAAPAAAARLRATEAGASGPVDLIPPEQLAPGDLVRVGPGEAFPTDGTVVHGEGGVDEAMLTGESRPVPKAPDSAVASGTCSIDGLFAVRVTAPAAQSAAARIALLLDQARRERAPAERLADRVAAILTPIVIVIALSAGAFWTVTRGLDHGILVALAVLVVACPCGLGIATPVAVWTGLAAAARRGVIARTAPALERAAAIGEVWFDKTGTLTERVPRLLSAEPAPASGLSPAGLLAHAAALEAGLLHPLARATLSAWRGTQHDSAAEPAPVTDLRTLPGRGIRGSVGGEPMTLGSWRFACEELTLENGAGAENDATTVLLWRPGQLLGTLRFAEAARKDARAAIAALRHLGLRIGLLSGDRSAAALVPHLVRREDAVLGLLPEEKVAHLKAHGGGVAMVGDGVNDAPALAAADLGIAVGSATDLARMSADVVIIGDDLTRIAWLFAYSRRVVRIIRQNLFWVFAYNAAAVALAAAGMLNPLFASLAMIGSSLLVVANARRLREMPDRAGFARQFAKEVPLPPGEVR